MLRHFFRAVVAIAFVAAAPRAAIPQTAVPIRALAASPPPAADPADPLFDGSRLHDISLIINSRDWSSLKQHFLDNTYYPCDFTWNGQTVRNVGIRSRGTGSRSGVKPGLRVDFDRYTTDQKFLGLKSVILRNNTQDPSGMRERLSMELFKRMGLVAEREAHARLFINNAYVGLYTIVESLDKTFLAKNFNEDGGHLYEYSFDNAAAAPFDFGYPGADPGLYTPVPFKPETLELDPQGQVLERLFWAANVASDAVWRPSIDEFLDLKKFIRHLAIENFLAEEDGLTGDYGPNNFYFYRFVNTNRFAFLPWDKSNTFWASPSYSILHNIEDGADGERNRLVVRALREEDLREFWLTTILECADSIAQPAEAAAWLVSEVARISDQIRAANNSDPSREVYTNADFEESIRYLTDWAQTRGDIVRAQVAADRARRGGK
ncbi:MAG: CotH kinase family protein [Vicinamibacterales bacterium]